MKLTCKEFEDMMYDYPILDNETRQSLDEHRRICACCRQEFELAREVKDVCAETMTPIPADFADNLMTTLQEEKQEAARPSAALPWLLAALALTAGAAVVLRHGVLRLFSAVAAFLASAAPAAADWFAGLRRGLAGVTAGIDPSRFPFQLDWTFWAAAALILLALTGFTMHRTGHDHA